MKNHLINISNLSFFFYIWDKDKSEIMWESPADIMYVVLGLIKAR
jgi:hypothetical protein